MDNYVINKLMKRSTVSLFHVKAAVKISEEFQITLQYVFLSDLKSEQLHQSVMKNDYETKNRQIN